MELFEDKGFRVKGTNLLIDPSTTKHSGAILTHAHSDHVNFNEKSKITASQETLDLINVSYKPVKKSNPLKFSKKTNFDNAKISLHNAGHILGSSQVLIEGEKTLAFTSDFKTQDSLILKKAEQLNSDILAIESTFGLPSFNFPHREKIYEDMVSWTKQQLALKRFIVLSGYSLGKAQELTKFCNDFLGISPVVHEKIFENNKVYEKHGVKLGTYYKLNHNLNDSNILIMPPSLAKPTLFYALEQSLGKKVSSALATGWFYRRGHDTVFPLSDHSDFNSSLDYIKNAEPKLVLTMHGFADEFARYIERRLKIPARALNGSSKKQKALIEFA